ncbi:MAG: beta-ketoacyl-ACP synthase III [Myxococcales bacterium]|nr:beta-ketoacyl-ACP synthase III [Myxococcales bacterium]
MRACISGTGLYTPPYAITNEELVAAFNEYVRRYNDRNAEAIASGTLAALEPSSCEFIEKASGIKSRYVMDRDGILDPDRMCPRLAPRDDDQLSLQAEIGVAAAKQALERAGRQAQEVDAVIVACANMQRAYPAMAIEIQLALGCGGYAYDMNVACSSATFALKTAVDAVRSGTNRCVLVINAEITSAHLDFRDRDSHFIFGDVCTAAVVEPVEGCQGAAAFEVLDARLWTQFSNNIRNNFGFLNRTEDLSYGPHDHALLFNQQGRKVFKEVAPAVVNLVQGQLAARSLKVEGLRRLWLHQANLNMNQLIVRKLLGQDVSSDRAPSILDEYANTASAGSIIVFHRHHEDLHSGDMGLICSFGAGYSIGSLIVRRV